MSVWTAFVEFRQSSPEQAPTSASRIIDVAPHPEWKLSLEHLPQAEQHATAVRFAFEVHPGRQQHASLAANIMAPEGAAGWCAREARRHAVHRTHRARRSSIGLPDIPPRRARPRTCPLDCSTCAASCTPPLGARRGIETSVDSGRPTSRAGTRKGRARPRRDPPRRLRRGRACSSRANEAEFLRVRLGVHRLNR